MTVAREWLSSSFGLLRSREHLEPCFLLFSILGQSVSQNEFDNDYGTMSINPGRSFQDFDFDESGGNESQTGNKTTIRTTITSLLW